MLFLLVLFLARFLSRPVKGLSSMSLLVSRRSSRMGSILSCSIATLLSTDAHWKTHLFSYWIVQMPSNHNLLDLTLDSPAVMFCRAPIAASRLVGLTSLFCRTSLYSATTLGCHSHSAPLGCRDTSESMGRYWLRCCVEQTFNVMYLM